MFVVQRRFGHSSSSTTENVCRHLTPEGDALALVDRRLPDIVQVDEEGAVVVELTKGDTSLPQFDVDDEDDLAA